MRLPLLVLPVSLAFASQIPFRPVSTTVPDILYADPDYEALVHLLQRARLIPSLNRLNATTFFAPTNDAIHRHASTNPLWQAALQDPPHFPLADNVQEKLRQQLFYHLLNYTLADIPTDNSAHVLDTLLFPRKPPEHPTHEPPPSPPWTPVPGGTLGGAPQRLRITARDEHGYVGVDAFGKGGVEIVKEKKKADNGVVFGIGDMLVPPPDLAHVLSQQASLSFFHSISNSNPTVIKALNSSSALTLFLPVNSAWDNLDPYERLYLESEFSAEDVTRILNMHAVDEKGVRWSDSLKHSTNLTTVDGTKLEIQVTDEKTKVSSAELVQPDIYASNGVLHLVSSLLIPPGALQLTPEKYLLALNCTKFVSLLHSVQLRSLINDTETKITILAPRDDVLQAYNNSDLPEKGSPALKKLLQYHFISGKFTQKKLENGTLMETMLQEEGLGGDKQVLPVEVSSDEKKASTSIHFGGAGVIGDPIELNNTVIYFISRPLTPPTDPLETALPHLDLSSFIAAVFSTSQADTLRKAPKTTLLIPRNSAFKRLGLLVSTHLLSTSAKQDLENVVLHHAIQGVQYARSITNGSQHTYASLEGSDVQFDRMKNGSTFISGSGGWADMKSEVFPLDLLTETGVIHELSDVMIPRTVQITLGKLVKAAKGSTMATLVVKAGFEWILNGTAPPENSPWANNDVSGMSWTLLCPTDEAFKKYDLDALYANPFTLQSIIAQHLIPIPKTKPTVLDEELNNNQPLPLVDSATYSTLYSASSFYGDIIIRQKEESNELVVGIKGARGTDGTSDWARVLSWGRSTTGGGKGGVVQIDQLLMPYYPSWWIEYGAPSTFGVFGAAAICAFFYGVRKVWQRDTTEATYEPVGGFGRDDES